MVYYMNEVLLVLSELTRVDWMKITYLDYLELMRMLNLIQNNYEPSKGDHVHRFWSIIAGKDSTINVVNFGVLFLAAMNIFSKASTVKDSLEVGSGKEIPEFNRFKKNRGEKFETDEMGFLRLRKQEVKEVYKEFKEFRTTRMFLGRIQKKGDLMEQRAEQHSKHRFHPTISNKSVELAKSKREK